MADFRSAYYLTMGHEGGYANDPDDVGGETYKGIARNYHSSWEGWKIVDIYKKEGGGVRELNEKLKNASEMQRLVELFYKQHFWDVNRLDSFRSQHIANEMFDTGVNMGIAPSVRMVQEALNVLNRNQQDYPNRTVDGIVGPNTLGSINNHPRPRNLFNMINIMQGNRYLEIVRRDETQERFMHGWLDRVELMR